MKIIDAHMHFSNMKSYKEMAEHIGTPSTLVGMEAWMADNDIIFGVAMGICDFRSNTAAEVPMLPDLNKRGGNTEIPYSRQIACCIGINPYQLIQRKTDYLKQVEALLLSPFVVGLKIYLGYYPFFAYDEVYAPIYLLGKQYDVPVVFHTGDLSVSTGHLQYAHPLSVDRVAVAFPDTKLVIAHLGNPWLIDAASVLLKNRNVFADLSGLIVGEFNASQVLCDQAGYFAYLKSALDYLFSYQKLMFASDWPFASPKEYAELIGSVIPVQFHELVFYQNALTVYSRLEKLLKAKV